MPFHPTSLPVAAVLLALSMPTAAVAQQAGTAAQQQENATQAAALRARIETVEARIATAQRARAIPRSRAAALRRQVAQVRRSMAGLSAEQGFVSGAEFASYTRTLGAIDIALDERGVARSYGDDALTAPPAATAPDRSFIVLCDCATMAERQRIADAVVRQGGTVLYTYRETAGLAVAAPAATGAQGFGDWLRRVPGVTDVRPNGSAGLHAPR